MSIQSTLDNFTTDLKEIPRNMRLFSLSMRSLYSEKALSSSSDTGKVLNKLRDDTRRDALVYVKGVLPISTQLVRCIVQFFEYYEALDLEEWNENLSDILDEVKGYKECCTEVVNLHEQIMVPLKEWQDEAKVLICELEGVTKQLEVKKRKFKESAQNKKEWALYLCYVPGINIIASPLLSMSAEVDVIRAVAEGQQQDINQSVIIVVGKTMIPALSAFIDGLNAAADFFGVVEQEMISFQTKGEKAMKDKKKLHYTMMKKNAVDIKESCRAFYAMIPGVRTDLQCIPEMPDDQNYVDKWLIKQRKEITKRYAAKITSQLRNMIGYFTTTRRAEHLMIE